VGDFLGTARNEKYLQNKTHMGKMDRDYTVLYLLLWLVLFWVCSFLFHH